MPGKHRQRVEHSFGGTADACSKCGLAKSKHRQKRIVGMAGVGRNIPDGRHAYVHIALVREDGTVLAEARREKGLTHRQCMKVLLAATKRDIVFGFQTMYHATHIMAGIGHNRDGGIEKFFIFHPEARVVDIEGHAVTPLFRWRDGGYSVCKSGISVNEGWRNGRWVRSTRVWDLESFTRRSWAESLEAWGLTKDSAKVDVRERARLTAKLARNVLDQIAGDGIDLRGRLRGVGSVAGTVMRQEGVAARRGPQHEDLPQALQNSIECAYSGGRQEIRAMGHVREALHEYDLSSAYAAALRGLPCLVHGRWRQVTAEALTRLRGASPWALVRFRVSAVSAQALTRMAWAPLPCRIADNRIVFGANFTGWAWWPEIEAALKGWPDIVSVEGGWVFEPRCSHKPFAFVNDLYAKRLGLEARGARGPADLIKQTLAAIYGKTLSRFGSPYKSLVWAGLTTAITRARVLEIAARYGDRVLSISTDAVVLRGQMPTASRQRALGAWSPKGVLEKGAFFYPDGAIDLASTDADDKKIIAAYRAGKSLRLRERCFFSGRDAIVAMVRCRKCGRSWGLQAGIVCASCGIVGGVPQAAYLKSSPYGQWGSRLCEVGFDPMPYREQGPGGALRVRDLGGVASLPFVPKTG
jgi:ribosomal protein L37E